MDKSNLKRRYQVKVEELVRIVKEVKPEKIILFGSLASGKVREDSDIDLCVIKRTKKPWKIKEKISDLMWKKGISFEPEADFRVYSPEVYSDWLKREDPFIAEIEKGKVVYEKSV